MRCWSSSIIIALVGNFAASLGGAQETNPFAAVAQELLAQRTVRSGAPTRVIERKAIERIYAAPAPVLLWSSAGGPTRQALAAIDLLAASDARGLAPADYDVSTLRRLAEVAGRSGADAARFDVALSLAMARFLADLHMGRVDPRTIRLDMPAHDALDLAALVTDVARAADVPAAVARAEPPYAGYWALGRVLTRYRLLAADTTLRPPRRAPRTVRPGDPYTDAPALARFLGALGDFDSASAAGVVSTPEDSGGRRYDGRMVDAVTKFQRRHGLDPDGVIGPATMAQLRVPLTRRVRQIELTLERWRWLPDRPPNRYVVVNIPAFRLYAFESDSVAAAPKLVMNVIVGQAEGRHDTPVFTATMREVVFRPYWDVPPRIARTELIPTFRRRPSYFTSEGFEIVRRNTGDVEAETFPPTAGNFARINAGTLRLRQRPGPANALGLVKFLFPNRYNVYLHDTPAPELFAHSRRDFSHGCIRIEQPTALAELVLAGQAPWDPAAIADAMTGTRTLHVPIARPLEVYVLYATVVVDEGGVVHFYPDLYRHDVVLEKALETAGSGQGTGSTEQETENTTRTATSSDARAAPALAPTTPAYGCAATGPGIRRTASSPRRLVRNAPAVASAATSRP